jgi:hypothetical protein
MIGEAGHERAEADPGRLIGVPAACPRSTGIVGDQLAAPVREIAIEAPGTRRVAPSDSTLMPGTMPIWSRAIGGSNPIPFGRPPIDSCATVRSPTRQRMFTAERCTPSTVPPAPGERTLLSIAWLIRVAANRRNGNARPAVWVIGSGPFIGGQC